MSLGKIKKLVQDKGFGFIQTDNGEDVFFHHSTVANQGFDDLTEGQQVEYTVEYVDAGWVADVARLPDSELDAITGRWIDLLEEDMGVLSSEEKPWIRLLESEVVRFCRAAGRSNAVFFAWSL